MRNENEFCSSYSALRTPHSALGFTLVEILIVILIISIVVGIVTLPLGKGGHQRKMEELSRQFLAVFRFVHDQAIFESKEIGLVLNLPEHEYYFVRLEEDQTWKLIEKESVFKKRTLSPEFLVDISQEGEAIKLFGEEEERKSREEHSPQIIFLSSGEITPFEIRISSKQVPTTYKITGQMNGDLKLFRDDREM